MKRPEHRTLSEAPDIHLPQAYFMRQHRSSFFMLEECFISKNKSTCKSKCSYFWRRHPDLNWGMKVLQTFALPLGYGAVKTHQDSSSIANAGTFVKSLPNSFFRRFWVLSGRAEKSGGAPAGGGTIRCDRGNHGTGEVCGRGTGRHRAGMLREGTRARYFLYVGALKWGWRQTRSRG